MAFKGPPRPCNEKPKTAKDPITPEIVKKENSEVRINHFTEYTFSITVCPRIFRPFSNRRVVKYLIKTYHYTRH